MIALLRPLHSLLHLMMLAANLYPTPFFYPSVRRTAAPQDAYATATVPQIQRQSGAFAPIMRNHFKGLERLSSTSLYVSVPSSSSQIDFHLVMTAQLSTTSFYAAVLSASAAPM